MQVPIPGPWRLFVRALPIPPYPGKGRYSGLPPGGLIVSLHYGARWADALWHPSQGGWRYSGGPGVEFFARPEGPVLDPVGVARSLAVMAADGAEEPLLDALVASVAKALGSPESLLVSLSVMES